MKAPLLVVPAFVLLLALSGCGDDTPASSPSESATGPCSYIVDDEAGEASRPVEPPPSTPEAVESLTIKTNRGDILVDLKSDTAPCTVNSFASLARQKFFDDTTCHRLTTAGSGIFVLQCGDPTASGFGGPGYRFANEVQPSDTFPAGTLAMAHSNLPDSNGSQFFMVYADTPLPADYTVFGSTDEAGLKVLQTIGAEGTQDGGADGPPAQEVRILSVQ